MNFPIELSRDESVMLYTALGVMSDALESYLTVVPDTSDREEAEKDILLIRRLQTRLAHANALHDLTVMENPHGNA